MGTAIRDPKEGGGGCGSSSGWGAGQPQLPVSPRPACTLSSQRNPLPPPTPTHTQLPSPLGPSPQGRVPVRNKHGTSGVSSWETSRTCLALPAVGAKVRAEIACGQGAREGLGVQAAGRKTECWPRVPHRECGGSLQFLPGPCPPPTPAPRQRLSLPRSLQAPLLLQPVTCHQAISVSLDAWWTQRGAVLQVRKGPLKLVSAPHEPQPSPHSGAHSADPSNRAGLGRRALWVPGRCLPH